MAPEYIKTWLPKEIQTVNPVTSQKKVLESSIKVFGKLKKAGVASFIKNLNIKTSNKAGIIEGRNKTNLKNLYSFFFL